ncbi:unnamed protein product [Ixodes pacificus]
MVLLFTILTYISGVTYYLSATVNPILYQVMSLKFRQAFVDTFGCCWPDARSAKSNADLAFASFYNHNNSASTVHSSSRLRRRRSISTQNLATTAASACLTTPDAKKMVGQNGTSRRMSASLTDVRNPGGPLGEDTSSPEVVRVAEV